MTELKLDFLKSKYTTLILLLLVKEETINIGFLSDTFKIKSKNLNKHINLLVNLMFITKNKDSIKLTPRGQYVATLLSNINFYLGGKT
jgi:predicted transcriptional regulator